jgi:hypothetical protein
MSASWPFPRPRVTRDPCRLGGLLPTTSVAADRMRGRRTIFAISAWAGEDRSGEPSSQSADVDGWMLDARPGGGDDEGPFEVVRASPLLANIALGALNDHVHAPWKLGGTMSTPSRRARRGANGLPNWRRARPRHGEVAETLHGEIAEVLAPMGLRLSPAKTQVVRLSLHGQATDPGAEGQDPCPNPHDISIAARGRAAPAQPDHARRRELLPVRSQLAHHESPRQLRMEHGDPRHPPSGPDRVCRSLRPVLPVSASNCSGPTSEFFAATGSAA